MFSPPTSVLAALSFRHLKLRKLQQKNLTMTISPENRWVKDQQVDSHFLISSFFDYGKERNSKYLSPIRAKKINVKS